eukprot:762581-Hanusia_phi.AAC.1
MVALDSLLKGLGKLLLDEGAVSADLNGHWEVTAEAIQTVLRREQVDGAYELLKEETRGAAVTEESINRFIDKLEKHETIKLGAERGGGEGKGFLWKGKMRKKGEGGFVRKEERKRRSSEGKWADVISSLRAISPSNYVGFFEPGEALEKWAESKLSAKSRKPVLDAITSQVARKRRREMG